MCKFQKKIFTNLTCIKYKTQFDYLHLVKKGCLLENQNFIMKGNMKKIGKRVGK